MNWKKCMTWYMKINGIMSERCIILLSAWLIIGDWSLQNSHFCPQIILVSCFIEDINFPFILVFQVLGPLESLAFAYVPSFQVCTPVITEVGPPLFPFHASGTKRSLINQCLNLSSDSFPEFFLPTLPLKKEKSNWHNKPVLAMNVCGVVYHIKRILL